MIRGADDPEILNGKVEAGGEEGALCAAYDSDLIEHMQNCWAAECDNAERMTKKINVLVSVLALLFGLGFFRIEWTYDPKHVSRIADPATLNAVKGLLIIALGCFGAGLFIGLKPTRRKRLPCSTRDPVGSASELLHFREDVIINPPTSDVLTRAEVFYRYSEAIDELRAQNAAKDRKVQMCMWCFMPGLILVFLAVSIYIACGVPPTKGDNHEPSSIHDHYWLSASAD